MLVRASTLDGGIHLVGNQACSALRRPCASPLSRASGDARTERSVPG
jgi:hypothetical protein